VGYIVALACFAAGIGVYRCLLWRSAARAKRVGCLAAVVFLVSLLTTLTVSNLDPPADHRPGWGVLLGFWTSAFAMGLSAHLFSTDDD
jgi:hypothetical protein